MEPATTGAAGPPGMSAPPLSLGLQPHLPWPLPALLAWTAGWAAWVGSAALGATPAWGAACGVGAGLLLAARCAGRWRRLLAAAGFPLSAWAVGGAALWPAWVWLMLVLPLVWLYPLRAWRDAPFFPTPVDALQGLSAAWVGAPPHRVLDAGCGLGHGLRALHRVWPKAEFSGLEWSRPLAWASAWRCRWAHIARGDMWAGAWAGYDAVYLFQRPESMARAYQKALSEMTPGSHLISLEFAVPEVAPLHVLAAAGRRSVWVYRLPAAAQGTAQTTPQTPPASTADAAGR